MKNITIPYDLFTDISKYIITVENGGQPVSDLRDKVIDGISDKYKKIAEHELYTRYKTAQTPEEKQRLKEQYCDAKGIPDCFRW